MKNSASFIVIYELNSKQKIEVIEIEYSDKNEIPNSIREYIVNNNPYIYGMTVSISSIAKLD